MRLGRGIPKEARKHDKKGKGKEEERCIRSWDISSGRKIYAGPKKRDPVYRVSGIREPAGKEEL